MGKVVFHRRSSAGDSVSVVDFCEPNLNLLAHAQAIELLIGSRCGGHGKCGGDRVRVLPESTHPLSPITEDERRLLKAEEIAGGLRLACQAFPESEDVEVHVEIFV